MAANRPGRALQESGAARRAGPGPAVSFVIAMSMVAALGSGTLGAGPGHADPPGIATSGGGPAHPSPAVPSPVAVRVFDTPNDPGRSITIEWTVPEGLVPESEVSVVRLGSAGLETKVGQVAATAGTFVDGGNGRGVSPPGNGIPFNYLLRVIESDGMESPAASAGPVAASGQWFHRGRANVLIILAVFAAFLAINIERARRGKRFYIRNLPPVDAMEEAIGRATEMGRPVLYVPGIEDVEDIQTIASMLILGKIAEKTARYDVGLRVPVRHPFVLAVADEVVKTGCTSAGRPDAYQPGSARYVSSEQFAYCAGVNGIILREKPAANLYLGRFFAESLIFAETGFAAGSIQIAGTAEVTQLPFFIAACDYTLIGEEFFAAGAYLTQDPTMLSTLRAADWAKVALVVCLGLGAVLLSLDHPGFREWFQVQ